MSVFSRGAIKPPANARPPSSPKIMTSSQYCGTPPTCLASVLLLPLFSHQLTALKRKDTSACPLWMSMWPRISAGWKARASHPSKLYISTCWRCTLRLCFRSSRPKFSPVKEVGLDAASLRNLRSTTDLALHATKASAQAIGSLVVLECHLWLTMAEM